MIEAAYIESAVAVLRNHPDVERFDPGLTDGEIESVQRKCGLIFPPDLRAFLQFAPPVGVQFSNWREGPDEELRLAVRSLLV